MSSWLHLIFMSILIDKNTRLIVQGLTGREGTFHAKQAAAYGTNVVGGVTPGRAARRTRAGPFSTPLHDAVQETGADASVIFVPPPFAADADHGIGRRRPRARRLHHRGFRRST